MSRHYQKVFVRNGHYVVLTKIGRKYRKDGKNWEIEHSLRSEPYGLCRTRLYYRRTWYSARLLIRELTAKVEVDHSPLVATMKIRRKS